MVRLGLYASGAWVLLTLPAFAEMGSPPSGDRAILSLQGGIQQHTLGETTGHGVGQTNLLAGDDRLLRADQGWFLDGTLGLRIWPETALFDRVELSVGVATATDAVDDYPRPNERALLSTPDGQIVAAAADRASSELSRKSVEVSVALKRDFHGSASSLTLGVVPFVRHGEDVVESIVAGAGRLAIRHGEVDSWGYGAMLIAGPELPLTDRLALVGHVGIGAYRFEAEGEFCSHSPGSSVFDAAVSDTIGGVGLRSSLGIGLKHKLTDTVSMTAFGSADYFSEVPTGKIATNQVGQAVVPSQLALDDAWELRAGIRLTFGLMSVGPAGQRSD